MTWASRSPSWPNTATWWRSPITRSPLRTPGTHVWPTNFEDVRQAVRWLKTNSGRFGIDPNKVAVWGESAGGHLANLLGTDPDAR